MYGDVWQGSLLIGKNHLSDKDCVRYFYGYDAVGIVNMTYHY